MESGYCLNCKFYKYVGSCCHRYPPFGNKGFSHVNKDETCGEWKGVFWITKFPQQVLDEHNGMK